MTSYAVRQCIAHEIELELLRRAENASLRKYGGDKENMTRSERKKAEK